MNRIKVMYNIKNDYFDVEVINGGKFTIKEDIWNAFLDKNSSYAKDKRLSGLITVDKDKFDALLKEINKWKEIKKY